jgi:hypothetical protein
VDAARAELAGARAARARGELERAAAKARAALAGAEAARAGARSAGIWRERLAIDGERGRPTRVLEDAVLAAATLARLGDPPALRAEWALRVGLAHVALGAFEEAERSLGDALALAEQAEGRESAAVARVLSAQGTLARARGDLAGALATHERALAIEERASGVESAAVGAHHHNVAGVLRLLGRPADARARYERALEVESHALGPGDPKVGLTENSLGLLALESGDLREARRRFERARALLEARAHPDRALALFNLGRVAARERRHPEAVALFTAALDTIYATFGADHPRAWDALLERAASHRALGDAAAALVDLEAARRGAAALADESLEAKDVLRRVDEARRPAAPRPRARPDPRPSTAGYGPAQP